MKSFGAVRALDGATLSLRPGEIHALLGENGAGKSTLAAIAAGLLAPDGGRILRGGRALTLHGPREARDAGVALAPQHDLLIEAATVADNLALLDPRAPWFERAAARRARVGRCAEELGLDLGEPDARVHELSVGTRQRIEIAGALLAGPAVLILDEPTAVLSPDESAALFRALRRKVRDGSSVLVITHRVGEVFASADRLTLLSRGRTILESDVASSAPDEVASRLVAASEAPEKAIEEIRLVAGASAGSPASVSLPPPHAPGASGTRPALLLRGFSPPGFPEPVDLALDPGELLTLLSIDGNGADVLASAIAGLRPASGRIELDGRALPAEDPRAFRAAGGRFVPGDRRGEGIVASFSIAENLALSQERGFALRPKVLDAHARRRIAEFGIRAPGPRAPAGQLSGGNQQKLVLARELATPARVLVAIHPTRGLDLASSADVRRRIAAAREGGTAVVVVCAEPDDARAFGGAIRVVYRSRLTPELGPESGEMLGRLMAGLAA